MANTTSPQGPPRRGGVMGPVARAFYRALLLAFPRRVREEVGTEMRQMLEHQLNEARPARGRTAAVWWSAIVDALRHGLAERLSPVTTPVRASRENGVRWRWWLLAVRQDVRYAWRMLVRQRGLTIVALLTLALGIGANSAIFSAIDAVLLRPLPYPDADRLVMVWESRPREGVSSNLVAPADFLDWARSQTSFAALAAHTVTTVDLTGTGEPVRLSAGTVSPPFFDVLGVRMAHGRGFRPEEAVTGRHRVVILGQTLWRERFNGDAAAVGRTAVLQGVPHEIVGILPATFEFPDDTLALWVPLALDRGSERPQARTNHHLEVYGRLATGVTLAQARADMDRVAARIEATHPDTNRDHGAYVAPLGDELRGPVREGLLTLLVAVAFVLLIACVNVANLLLARAAARRREVSIRAALGAGRWRLAGQALTESVLLAVLGGIGALLVAHWGIGLLRQITPPDLQVLGSGAMRLDARVLGFTFVLSVATGVLFGSLPAWQLASQDANDGLKAGGPSPAGIRKRMRTALIVSEIALASMLLVGAGLVLRSFQTVLRADPGVRLDGLLTAFVSVPPARYTDDARRVAAYDEIERRMASLPGVRSVGATSHLPLAGQDSRAPVRIEGRESTPDAPTRAHPRAVTLDYFRTMGIRLRAGRSFTPSDDSHAPFVVIVNETMARRYWPGASPVGKRLTMGGSNRPREVVGVVSDVKHWGFDRGVNPELYLPQKQMVWDGLSFVLATDVDPATLAAAVRAELKAVDPDLALSDVKTMAEVGARSVAGRRSTLLLLSIFGALALVLSGAGVHAVMAHLVALRATEIGVRLALGGRPGRVMRMVLGEALLQAVAGLAIGLTAGVVVMRGLDSVLYQVSPADPATLGTVALLLLATALLASLAPARRAMRVDPVDVLRG